MLQGGGFQRSEQAGAALIRGINYGQWNRHYHNANGSRRLLCRTTSFGTAARISGRQLEYGFTAGCSGRKYCQTTLQQVQQIEFTGTPTHIGVGFPGIVRNGTIEDSPNLIQFKGVNMQALLTEAFAPVFGKLSVSIFNDADVVAAGIAATSRPPQPFDSRLDAGKWHRVWPLSLPEGVWEAGHSVVTLNRKSSSAAAEAGDTSKALWVIGRCVSVSWISNPMKSFEEPSRGRSVVAIS